MMKIFESWQPMLKDPNQVKNFKIVQDLLERKGKINLGFLGRVFKRYHDGFCPGIFEN